MNSTIISVPSLAILFQPFWFYRADRITESHTRTTAILTRLLTVGRE